MAEFWIPDESSGEIITASQLEAVPVRDAVERWQALKGAQSYPEAPDDVMAPVSANTLLIEVLGEGEDYQYLRVGEALVAAFGEDFSGQCLSEIEQTNPRFGIGLRMLYEMVRAGGEPLCYRGWAGQDMPGAQFVYYESAVLPFGHGLRVDHILVISMLVLRGDPRSRAPDDLRV
jgi:hypothetical protein